MRKLHTYCSLLGVSGLLLCVSATACSDKPTEDTATTTATTSASASDSTGAPTTGTPTTGTTEDPSGGSGSATSSTTADPTTTAPTTDPTTTGPGSSSSGGETDTGVMVACDGAGASNLAGVCIVFPPQEDSFTLAEAAGGLLFNYVVVVTADVLGVTPESQVTCGMPGSSGLYVGERVEGDGQSYCVCDSGLCPAPNDPPIVLKAGEYPASLAWDGKNWNGPSDTNNPKGPPFPPGAYTVKLSAIGQHEGQGFEVTAELPITLTP